MTEDLIITKMDGVIDDNAIKGDFICITNVDYEKILEWIDKHKWQSSISYKDREFKGKTNYPSVFIFENKMVVDKFIEAINIAMNSIEGFLSHDIKYALSSSIDNIRIIKRYEIGTEIQDSKGMCEFIDIKSFESKKEEDIFESRVLVKIYDIDYSYREVFYCI